MLPEEITLHVVGLLLIRKNKNAAVWIKNLHRTYGGMTFACCTDNTNGKNIVKSNMINRYCLLHPSFYCLWAQHRTETEKNLTAAYSAGVTNNERTGNLLFLSGKVCQAWWYHISGRVETTIEQDVEQPTALHHLAVLANWEISKRIVKCWNCEGDFKDHPKVINGLFWFYGRIFGGRRLPFCSGHGITTMAVEIEYSLLPLRCYW